MKIERIRFDELAEDLITDYKVNLRKSLVRTRRSINHLNKPFEGIRVVDITTDQVNVYPA